MTNHLSKFTPNLAKTTKNLHDLLAKKNHWTWGEPQQKAFEKIKQQLSSSPVLAIYNPEKQTIVAADASSYGLGTVLSQIPSDGTSRAVAYASRSLTSTEVKYAQIEKESLAITYACERFSDYLIGKPFHIFTDHKPLVSLLGSKLLDSLPPRVQRFRTRLMRFTYTISHVPGKNLTVADTLSRAPVTSPTSEEMQFSTSVEAYVNLVLQGMPATEKRLEQIQQAQKQDTVWCKLIKYCQEGWPQKNLIPGPVKSYVHVAAELTVQNDLLLRGSRIVIPVSLQPEILEKLHNAHQGIHKCRQRAQQSVWWLGLNRQLTDLIYNCRKCCKDRRQHPEPLISSEFPSLPWQKLATDLFYRKGSAHLLIIDYYLRYIDTAKLSSESSSEIIRHTESILSRHGIPKHMFSDNGPQYSSLEYKKFAEEYGFLHTTSSPRFPQIEWGAVKTVKAMLKKSDDPYLAMLIYRSTLLQNGCSPAELLMNHHLQTNLPITETQLKPKVPDFTAVKTKEEKQNRKQKKVFDSRHATRELDPLLPGEEVWVQDHSAPGKVVEPITPRSYHVSILTGLIRRNRFHLRRIPNEGDTVVDTQSNNPQPVRDSDSVMTRSGCISKPPSRWSPGENT